MGDSHFLLQNTLTGFIFLVFVFLSAWVTNEQVAFDGFKFLSNQLQMAAIIATTPILGVVVQGLWMFLVYLRNHPYDGMARQQAATRIRLAINALETVPSEVKKYFNICPDDSLFVWLFYSFAPEHLIEWDRRRRDFQHLGENWATATVSGCLLGSISGLLLKIQIFNSKNFIILMVIMFVIIWIFGLVFLRYKMKKDSEALEATFTYINLYPDLKEAITKINSKETNKSDQEILIALLNN